MAIVSWCARMVQMETTESTLPLEDEYEDVACQSPDTSNLPVQKTGEWEQVLEAVATFVREAEDDARDELLDEADCGLDGLLRLEALEHLSFASRLALLRSALVS